MSRRIYGIDLGTTYSCLAYVDEHGKAIVASSAEGELTTPSAVFFESPSSLVVGRRALELQALDPARCVRFIKRAVGNPHWAFNAFGQTYKPQDISSFILRKVAGDAEKRLGEKVEDVVITCPAHFGINEKEVTRQAGILAGLNVLYVIPEPTAAALAYGITQERDQVIVVYDLGGGTFDVTLLEVKAGELNVICTGGDHQLGGTDWDDAIVGYFTQEFETETGTPADSFLEDNAAYQELLKTAERCKRTLSNHPSVIETLRFAGKEARVELTREIFDQITAQYLERTLALTEQELGKARDKGYTKIDKLLLVGGSTYMPQVIETVKRRFPFEVQQFDPTQAVAKGAALFGYKYSLDEQIKLRVKATTGEKNELDLRMVPEDVLVKAQKQIAQDHGLSLPNLKKIVNRKITNVTSKSFGFVVINRQDREVVMNLIEIDDAVPKTITQKFGTFEANQTGVDLRCMENSIRGQPEVEISDCREIGLAVLFFTRPLPRNSPVEITFELGPDGLLALRGRDLTSGGKVDAFFKTEAIMSREELATSERRNRALWINPGSSTSTEGPKREQRTGSSSRDKIFISYSHRDRDWLERLQKMLKPLLRNASITLWDDTRIDPGKKWKDEITRALMSARVAVLLVSGDFLASDFVVEHELPPLLEAAEREGVTILWVYLSHCLYDETELANYQAAHDIALPLESLSTAEQNRVLVQVCKRIKDTLE